MKNARVSPPADGRCIVCGGTAVTRCGKQCPYCDSDGSPKGGGAKQDAIADDSADPKDIAHTLVPSKGSPE